MSFQKLMKVVTQGFGHLSNTRNRGQHITRVIANCSEL